MQTEPSRLSKKGKGVHEEGKLDTNLCAEHAQDLAAFVVDDGLLDLVVQDRDGEAALVVRVGLEIDLSDVRKGLVTLQRVGDDVHAGSVSVLGGREAPALGAQVPVHGREGDDVLQALQLAGDQCSVGLASVAQTC